jgi:hypothetical protein
LLYKKGENVCQIMYNLPQVSLKHNALI